MYLWNSRHLFLVCISDGYAAFSLLFVIGMLIVPVCSYLPLVDITPCVSVRGSFKKRKKEKNALFINHHIQRLGPKLSNPHLLLVLHYGFAMLLKNNGFIIVSVSCLNMLLRWRTLDKTRGCTLF